jgi:hypothetical protein
LNDLEKQELFTAGREKKRKENQPEFSEPIHIDPQD